MIQPAAIDANQATLRTWKSSIVMFYVIAFSLSILNFLPIILRPSDSAIHAINSPILFHWILSCCVLAIPLILEFILDIVAATLNPIYYQNVLEHRFGHLLLLFSLSLPVVLLGAISHEAQFDAMFCRCLLSFCEAVSVSAVFGMLQVFGLGECWKAWNSLLILALFLVTQLVFNFIWTSGSARLFALSLSIATGVVRLALIIWFARAHFREMFTFMLQKNQSSHLTNNKYRCFAFVTLIFLYFFARLIVNIYFLSTSPANLVQTIVNRLILLMILAVGGAVIPGRMFRRGVVALKVEQNTFHVFMID